MFRTAHFVLLLGLWGQQGSKKISDREAVEERAEKKPYQIRDLMR